MTESLRDLATLALAHDAGAALRALGDRLPAGDAGSVGSQGSPGSPESAESEIVQTFIQILNCEFDAASGWHPHEDDPLTGAMARFVAAVCLARVPSAQEDGDEVSAMVGLQTFATVEAAMSAGQILQAETYARRLSSTLVGLDRGVYWAWNQVALARSLAFQGRFTEAQGEVELVLGDPQRSAWPAVDRIARGVQAFIAAHQGDGVPVSEYIAELRQNLPHPQTYMESAAFVLAGFAEQALGRADQVADLILHGGGGEYLPRFQIVDRVYAYEVLIEAALLRSDPVAAQGWLQHAEALPIEHHDMASAAVGRGRARIALALDDPEAGARELLLAGERAALVGGSLEVFRSALLRAVASRAQGAPIDVEGLERIVQLAASTGARVVREWAVRELSLRGRRLRNVPGHGWEGLTDRQRLVAMLAAQGLRNREIGAQLFVSERTVEGHIAAVLDALGAPSRVGIGAHLPGSGTTSTASTVPTPGSLGLTARQQTVAGLIAGGQSNAAIARALGISEKTVEKHVADLFERLKVRSRSGVAALIRGGLLAEPEVADPGTG